MEKTTITAHSGCERTPDNSVEFLRLAMCLPVDAAEVDVCRGADGALALSHELSPAPDAVKLEQAFLLLAGRPEMRMNCDLKEDGLEPRVLALAERAGVRDRLIFSGNVGLDLLRSGGSLADQVTVYLNFERILRLPESAEEAERYGRERLLDDMFTAVQELREYRFACLNLHYRFCTEPFAEALARENIAFSAWTPDRPEEIRSLCSLGAANITTRNPRMAVRIRGEFSA